MDEMEGIVESEPDPTPPGQKLIDRKLIEELELKQKPFWPMIKKMEDLFWALPNLSLRQVDERLEKIYEDILDAAGAAGISRMSVPRWRECCGKKRVWFIPSCLRSTPARRVLHLL